MASLGYRGVLSGGATHDRFRAHTLAGVDASLGVALPLGRGFEAELAATYTRYFATFSPEPGDAYIAGGHDDDALREANWLATHRGRAYAENNVQRMLTPLNVVQSDLALLTGAELLAKLHRGDEAGKQLDAFRKAWPDADRIALVAPRVKALDAALANTPARASTSN